MPKELARYSIRVNAVAPGSVKTVFWDEFHAGETGERHIEAMTRTIPMRRFGTPEDMASVVESFVERIPDT